jgi:hypothetical protein
VFRYREEEETEGGVLNVLQVASRRMREEEVHTSWRIRWLGHITCVRKKCIGRGG